MGWLLDYGRTMKMKSGRSKASARDQVMVSVLVA